MILYELGRHLSAEGNSTLEWEQSARSVVDSSSLRVTRAFEESSLFAFLHSFAVAASTALLPRLSAQNFRVREPRKPCAKATGDRSPAFVPLRLASRIHHRTAQRSCDFDIKLIILVPPCIIEIHGSNCRRMARWSGLTRHVRGVDRNSGDILRRDSIYPLIIRKSLETHLHARRARQFRAASCMRQVLAPVLRLSLSNRVESSRIEAQRLALPVSAHNTAQRRLDTSCQARRLASTGSCRGSSLVARPASN